MNNRQTLHPDPVPTVEETRRILSLLESAGSVFSIAHPFSDGDALGSQLALHRFCLARGKRSWCLNFDPIPDQLSWLYKPGELVESLPAGEKTDLAFLMETTDVARMGDRARLFDRAVTRIHLDHHVGVKGLGDLSILADGVSSTCEILYPILKAADPDLPLEILEPLYVGILTDTGNFKYSNTTRRAHEIAGEILAAGLDVYAVYKKIYESNSLNRVLIHGTAMSRARFHGTGGLIYSWLTLEDFTRIGASEVDGDGCITHLVNVVGVEAALLFREREDGTTKVSLRSTGNVDVQRISKVFGGGGHKLAAGANLPGPLRAAIEAMLDEFSRGGQVGGNSHA